MDPYQWQQFWINMGLLAVIVSPFVVYLTWHRRKMEEIRLKASESGKSDLINQLRAVQRELQELRIISAQLDHDGSFNGLESQIQQVNGPHPKASVYQHQQPMGDVQALRQELLELRDISTQYDVTFDNSLKGMESRLQQIEQRMRQLEDMPQLVRRD